ncbi:MAG: glycosyltransferase, partial [Actinomycetota bacterium]
ARERRLLFHSYHFPPIGGAGAQRPLRLARHLLEHGYVSTIVTGAGATSDRWTPEDQSLLAKIPPELEITRLRGSTEPRGSAGWASRIERLLARPSEWERWWVEQSTAAGMSIAGDADLIYVWMQPYASAEAGARLAAASKTPWVADLGDPWALDEMMVYLSALHRRVDAQRMARHLSTASAIVMSTPEAVARLLERFPSFRNRPVVAIPNGFDGTDFAGSDVVRDDGKFRIVHTGYLHTELGQRFRNTLTLRRLLRGSAPGLDILPRSHVFLIEAIDRLLQEDPTLNEVLELHLAGVLTDADREVAARCPVLRLQGYVTHAESIELMRGADLLFLPMQKLPPRTRATIVPGKTYEYLASGTPVLAAVPEGDARDLLQESGNALLCRPDDVSAITDALRSAVTRWREGITAPAPRSDVVARFEYRRLAARLAGVFDDVLSARS